MAHAFPHGIRLRERWHCQRQHPPLMMPAVIVWTLVFTNLGSGVATPSLQHAPLQIELAQLTQGFDGRVGISVRDAVGAASVNETQRFPLQSVMKLLVGVAVMDAVDHRGWRLTDTITIRRQDLSLAIQPLAKLVTENGFHTTIDDLVRRAIVQSDSAATDVLVARLGGPTAVQAALDRHHLVEVRFDRDEKHLQTETAGLEWRPEYVDSTVLDRAYAAVSDARRGSAFRAYQIDPRDTATPRGMAALLQALSGGTLLSATSTARLLEIMAQTTTFPDRLKAGMTGAWTLAHKTGTSDTWQGVTAATNDVGIMTAPDGQRLSIVVFIADSPAPSGDRAALMAAVARATIKHYRSPISPGR